MQRLRSKSRGEGSGVRVTVRYLFPVRHSLEHVVAEDEDVRALKVAVDDPLDVQKLTRQTKKKQERKKKKSAAEQSKPEQSGAGRGRTERRAMRSREEQSESEERAEKSGKGKSTGERSRPERKSEDRTKNKAGERADQSRGAKLAQRGSGDKTERTRRPHQESTGWKQSSVAAPNNPTIDRQVK